jgi:peptide/nickel transport system substrate-binding protein
MKQRRLATSLIGLVAAVGLLASACGGGAAPSSSAGSAGGSTTAATGSSSGGGSTSATGSPQMGGTLTVALDGALDTLDPQKSVTIVSNQVRENIYERLIQYAPDLQTLQPMLATSWDVSPDGLTYTFHLRQGVKFSDGHPFTADDVVYTYNRMESKAEASPRVSDWTDITAVKKVDPYTVEFDLAKPYAPFLTTIEGWQILPDEPNVDFNKTPIGTGPFMMKEWVPNDHITLVKNPNYWQPGHPYLDSVVFKFIPDSQTRVVDLETGAVNVLNSVPFDRVQELAKNTKVNLLQASGFVRDTLGFNDTKPPFNNPLVRQALSMAIDRDTIVKTIMFGYATATSDPIVPGTPWSDQAADQALSYNMTKAKQLLQQAGLGGGFSTTIKVSPTYPQEVQMAQVIQQAWQQLGVKTTIDQLEWSTWIQQVVVNKDFDVEIVLHSSSPGPDSWTYNWLVTKGSVNLVNYSSPQMDQLLNEGRQTSDQQKQVQIYDQVQQLFAKDAPWTNIDYEKTLAAETKNVQGWVLDGRTDMDFVNTWLSGSSS